MTTLEMVPLTHTDVSALFATEDGSYDAAFSITGFLAGCSRATLLELRAVGGNRGNAMGEVIAHWARGRGIPGVVNGLTRSGNDPRNFTIFVNRAQFEEWVREHHPELALAPTPVRRGWDFDDEYFD